MIHATLKSTNFTLFFDSKKNVLLEGLGYHLRGFFEDVEFSSAINKEHVSKIFTSHSDYSEPIENDLSNLFQPERGVRAASAASPAAEKKTEFDVVLQAAGNQILQVMKQVMELTGRSLKEAKDLVDGAPVIIKKGISKDEAESIKSSLEELGAEIEIK
ncbi:MAG: 50S ribosomal protein L7/L12 [Bacteroidales bacterium]|nr:50S ribosomal protein L7/L12 [Bacteroidales bacterium]